MGFFSSLGQINRINNLLKSIEPKVNAIQYEAASPYPNINRIRVECGSIAVLMSEITDIMQSASNSVMLAPYYFFGRKMSIFEISSVLAGLLDACDKLDQ